MAVANVALRQAWDGRWDGTQRWSRKSEQGDKRSFCLTAGTAVADTAHVLAVAQLVARFLEMEIASTG